MMEEFEDKEEKKQENQGNCVFHLFQRVYDVGCQTASAYFRLFFGIIRCRCGACLQLSNYFCIRL